MLVRKKLILILLVIIPYSIFLNSCDKKDEQQTFVPPNQETVDKEKEQQEREEFERLKRLRDGITDSASINDTTSQVNDSVKAAQEQLKKKSLVEKEKELNKRLDNPKDAITDYLEYLKRGTSEGGNFEKNMTKASEQWTSSNVDRFKKNYKNTKKIVVLEEPRVISQSGNNATVQVKIRKVDVVNDADQDLEMTVRYNLIADSKGKWKIKNNEVDKK